MTMKQVPGFLLALMIGAAACAGAGKSADPPASTPPVSATPAVAAATEVTFSMEQVQHGGVRWSAAAATVSASAVEVPGQLVPSEDATARLSAPAQGRLVSIRVKVGDRVSRGQSLVTLQSPQATAARADQSKAIAELNARRVSANYAKASRERAERLLAAKALSRQEVERAQVDDELAQSAVAQAQAELDRARLAMEQLGVGPSGDIVLRAPVAGVVLSRDAVPGGGVDVGTTLLTITDPSTLWLRIAATEQLASSLRPGTRMTFTVSVFPDEPFEGVVRNVASSLDPQTRTLPVHAVVRNTTGRLRPEMFATVRIENGRPASGVAVPDGAIQLLDERPVVFIAAPDATGGARFTRRSVEILARRPDGSQVVTGVKPGDLIVIAGAFSVKSQFSRGKMSEG